MEKLKQGDYVTNLTKEQFDELIKIEGKGGLLWETSKSSSLSFISKSILFSGVSLLHSIKSDLENKLPFEVFKQRAINTFKK